MVRTESREELQLVSQLEAGLIVADATGDVVVWNAAAERVFELPAAEAVGRPWTQLITVVHGGVTTAREVLGAAGLPGGWHGLVEAHVSNGKAARVRVHLQKIRDPLLETGRGYMAIFWSTDDPGRHIRRSIRGQPLPYQALFQRSPEACALSKLDGTLLDINEAAAEMFARPREEAIGTNYRAVLPRWTVDGEPGARQALMERGFFSVRTVGERKDGSQFPIEIVGTLISMRDDDFVFVRIRDLSHEDRLERMIEDLGDLARLSETPRDVREVAQRGLEIVAEALRAEQSLLLLSSADGFRVYVGPGTPESMRGALAGMDPSNPPLARKLADSREPFELSLPPDMTVPAWADRLRTLGFRTIWAIPAWFGTRLIGGFALLWRGAPAEPFDVQRLEQMGRLAGVGIGNAELREEMRRESELRVSLEGSARVGGAVVAQMSDAIVTTDRDQRVTAVNPAAERHYGFTATEAAGRRFDDVVETLRLDGMPLGRQIADESSSVGYWHGRVFHRPKIGTKAGQAITVDLSLTAIRDEHREPAGLIVLSREVTAAERLEAEAAALTSLAIATGRGRSRREVAEAAIERLCEATTAQSGIVVSIADGRLTLEAHRGIDEETAAAIRARPFSRELLDRIDQPGAIITLDAARAQGLLRTPASAGREQIAAGVFVGLRVRGETIGFVALGSHNPAWPRPSDDLLLQASAQIANALENARLMERLERGLHEEKQLTTQLETLVGLTQLPQGDITEETLARFLLGRVIVALDALAGAVVRPTDADRFHVVATYNREHEPPDPVVPDAIFRGMETRTCGDYYFWRRLSEGSGPFYVPIDTNTVGESAVAMLRDQGFRSYAIFPVREGKELVAAFICHFARASDEGAPFDSRTLEAVGRILEIAYGNIRMGEGLAKAVAHERRLAAEVHALQDLTLLGAASDDVVRLARETIESVVAATGAAGGGYILTNETTGRLEPIVWVGMPPAAGPASADASKRAEWREYEHLDGGERVCVCAPEPAAAPSSTGTRGRHPKRATASQATLPLHVDGRLVGALQLVWREPGSEELDVHFLEPIAQIASISLANFRLRAELIHRAAAQRSLSQRLDALDELTRIGEEASSFEELAHRTVNLVREALGATGVCYLLLEPGHHFETHAVAGETGAFRLWLKGVPAKDAPGGGPLVSGGSSVLGDFAPNQVSERVLPLARSTGFRSFGAIPIRIGEELAGALLCFFDRPANELTIDEAALDSVARIAGIALANFHLRERLVSSEERYRTLFEESPEAMLVSALDGTVLDANEAAVRLYRVNGGEILGRYIGQLTTADERELARRRQIVWAQGRGTFRDRGRRPDGSEFPVEIEIRVVELGGQRRFLSLFRDLSDQERLQRELLQAQKMEALGQLVSGVAHELNNPLAAIIAFSQLLRRDERLPDDMKHDAGLLVQEADRTRRIVQNLLDFARQRPPERRPTRIATLVQSVLELQSYALTTNRIRVAIDIPDDLPEVDLDRAQLQQVLLNLTINAIQAIRSQQRAGQSNLWVGACLIAGRSEARLDTTGGHDRRVDDGSRVRVTITDDGPGVPESARPRLFDPFFTTKQPGEGTGLGLSVSFGIVASHDGQLWYEPGPAGTGSSFIIELPVHARIHDERRLMAALEAPVAPVQPVPEARTPLPAPAPTAAIPAMPPVAPTIPVAPLPLSRTSPRAADVPAGSAAASASIPTIPPAVVRPQILVLDDEPSIRAFLRKALQVAGMEVVPFQDGALALEALGDAHFDVMLIDHRMAGMSGTEFYEAAIKLRPEVARRAVFMSGDVLNPDLRGFATRHGIRLLAKPFDIDAVTRVVREALASDGATAP